MTPQSLRWSLSLLSTCIKTLCLTSNFGERNWECGMNYKRVGFTMYSPYSLRSHFRAWDDSWVHRLTLVGYHSCRSGWSSNCFAPNHCCLSKIRCSAKGGCPRNWGMLIMKHFNVSQMARRRFQEQLQETQDEAEKKALISNLSQDMSVSFLLPSSKRHLFVRNSHYRAFTLNTT